MKQLTRLFPAILAAHALAFAVSASAGEPAEPETITIRGVTYAVVPDEQMRALGFEFADGTAQIMKIIIARELMGRTAVPY